MRPTYQTEEQLEAEKVVAEKYASYYHLKAVKRPELNELDYDLFFPLTGHKAATVEIKVRNYSYLPMIEKGGYMISAHKWAAIKTANEEKGVLGVLLVAFASDMKFQVFVLPLGRRPLNFTPVVGGRTRQQRDKEDIEKVVYIPWKWFTEMETLGKVRTENEV